MAESFLDLLESIEGTTDPDVDVPRMSLSELITHDAPEYAISTRSDNVARRYHTRESYNRAVHGVVRLIDRARRDRRYTHHLQEAMSTSDFSTLFGDVLDRQVLGFYAEWEPVWSRFMARGVVRDFRAIKLYSLTGGEGQLSEVKELSEYPARKLTPSSSTMSIKKYGARMPFSWEAMINDDLELLTDTPRRFARAARRSESKFATSLYVGASGPNTSVYTVANKNIVNTTNGATADNPPLSITALQDAMLVLAKMVDADNEPIVIDMLELVVPPALELTALNIMNATQIELTEAGATANQKMITANWMRNRFRVTVDPYIPIVASTANGNTSWFLFASASSNDRPAIRMNFLRGYEEPQLFMKSPNATRVGGTGLIDPMQGSFEDDSLDYKIRHIFGGGVVDAKMTVMSNGSGA